MVMSSAPEIANRIAACQRLVSHAQNTPTKTISTSIRMPGSINPTSHRGLENSSNQIHQELNVSSAQAACVQLKFNIWVIKSAAESPKNDIKKMGNAMLPKMLAIDRGRPHATRMGTYTNASIT